MQMKGSAAGLALLSACAAVGIGAQPADGDPVAGLGIARTTCAACHRIDGAEGTGPKPGAPDFATIAKIPSLAGMGLRVFLRTPHGDMPRIQFTDRELDDLVAYVRSLAR